MNFNEEEKNLLISSYFKINQNYAFKDSEFGIDVIKKVTDKLFSAYLEVDTEEILTCQQFLNLADAILFHADDHNPQ